MTNESLVGDSQDRHHIVIVGILFAPTKSDRVVSPRKGCFRFPRLSVRFVAEKPGSREPYSALVEHACNGVRGTMCNNAESLSLGAAQMCMPTRK